MSETSRGNNDPLSTVDNQADQQAFALSGKIMLSVIVILFFAVLLMVTLHLYARWYLLRARRLQLLRRRSRSNHNRRSNIVFYVDNNFVSDPANRGLEVAVLNWLPVFVYPSKTHQAAAMDCAVCLSEFEENEKIRLLPKCKHSFHIECIDMWFHSHSTCPLCRSPIEPVVPPENNRTDDGAVIPEGEPETWGVEPTWSSGPCTECYNGDEGSSTTSLGARRKGLDFTGVRIEVPPRSEFQTELELSSPAGLGYRSPGTRLLSLRRILSMGRKTPTAATPSGVGPGCGPAASEIDLERGATEVTQSSTPSREMELS